MMSDALTASIAPPIDTSPVSFWRDTRSFNKGGTCRRTAWGSTTCRSACRLLRPSERAAARCEGCTDSMPARNTSATYAE